MEKVLLPIDGSKRSFRTVEATKRLFKPDECEIIVAKVIGARLYHNTMDEIKYYADNAKPELDKVREILPGYTVSTQVLLGSNPGVELVEYAREAGIDTIVMTRSSRGPLRKLGSVTTHVVKNADFLDVMVLKEKDVAEE